MRILIFIFTLTFISCAKRDEVTFTLPSDKDINEIIKIIINSDSLPVFKTDMKPDTLRYEGQPDFIRFPIKIPFIADLDKIIIYPTPSPNNDIDNLTPPPYNGIYFSSLLYYGKKNNVFTDLDSLYVFYQNDTLKSFKLSNEITEQIYIIKTQPKENDEDTRFYSCSIPIFSTNNQYAYVELQYHCYGECSYTNGYILKKINNTWTLVDKRTISVA